MISKKEATELITEKRTETDRQQLTDEDVTQLMQQASAISESRALKKSATRGIEMAINKLARRRDDLLQDDSVKAWTYDMAGKDDDEIEANWLQRAIEVIKR